jgi:1,4-dihydroxy-2-naphthoate octaprenyltransferase
MNFAQKNQSRSWKLMADPAIRLPYWSDWGFMLKISGIHSEQDAPALAARPNWLKVTWSLFRPHTLTASFIPVLIGSALAWQSTGHLRVLLLAAMLLASVLIQAATNMFNEYFDYVRGLDSPESVGISGAITLDGVRPTVVFRLAVVSLAVSTLLGVFICAQSSWWLAPIGVLCMMAGYFYAGGPHPISATPFGELFAGGFMGSGIILLSCFIQQKFVNSFDLLASIPSAILIGAILTANNIRDLEGDQEHGRRTLVILLGHAKAVRFLAGGLIAANLWIAALVAARALPPGALLALGSLLPSLAAIRILRAGGTPAQMMPGMKRVAQTNTLFGILLLIGLLIHISPV